MSTTPKGLSSQQATQVANTIAPQMQELQSILAQASAQIQNKAKAKLDYVESSRCSDSCITSKLSALVAEISCTVRGVVNILGVG
jgi:hypothetical protein